MEMVVIYRKIFNSGESILWTVFVCFGDMLFDPSFFEFTLANWARGFIHYWYSCYALFLRSFTRFCFILLFSYLYFKVVFDRIVELMNNKGPWTKY